MISSFQLPYSSKWQRCFPWLPRTTTAAIFPFPLLGHLSSPCSACRIFPTAPVPQPPLQSYKIPLVAWVCYYPNLKSFSLSVCLAHRRQTALSLKQLLLITLLFMDVLLLTATPRISVKLQAALRRDQYMTQAAARASPVMHFSPTL